MAIPLSMVTRLEEFPASSVETMGALNVVQYRGQIMPLVYISDVLPERRKEKRAQEKSSITGKDSIHIVVYTRNERSVGVVVNDILDIVDDTLSVKQPPGREGVLFSAVIQNRVTELLDIEAIINAAGPKLFEPQPALKGLGLKGYCRRKTCVSR